MVRKKGTSGFHILYPGKPNKWGIPVTTRRHYNPRTKENLSEREWRTRVLGGRYEKLVPPEQRKQYKPRKPKVVVPKKQKAILVGSFPHAYNRHVPPLDLKLVLAAVQKIRGNAVIIALWGIFEYDDTIEPDAWKKAKPRAKSAKFDKQRLINILTMAIVNKDSAVDIAPIILQLDLGERAYWIVGAIIRPSRFVAQE